MLIKEDVPFETPPAESKAIGIIAPSCSSTL
jgi:hypothetical protein